MAGGPCPRESDRPRPCCVTVAAVALRGSRVEQDQLTELYLSRYSTLVHTATLLLGGAAGAEDVVQEAYVRLLSGLRRVRDQEAVVAYLRATVVNLCRSNARHAQVVRRHSDALVTGRQAVESAEMSVLRDSQQEAVLSALRRLPVRQREAVVLRYWAELEEPAIAAAMGVAAGSVKTHLARGRAALAATLEEYR